MAHGFAGTCGVYEERGGGFTIPFGLLLLLECSVQVSAGVTKRKRENPPSVFYSRSVIAFGIGRGNKRREKERIPHSPTLCRLPLCNAKREKRRKGRGGIALSTRCRQGERNHTCPCSVVRHPFVRLEKS